MGPDQRFRGVLDTSPFRLAIVYSVVFACGAAALLGAVNFAVSRVVDGSTDNLIEAEVQGLRELSLVLVEGVEEVHAEFKGGGDVQQVGAAGA